MESRQNLKSWIAMETHKFRLAIPSEFAEELKGGIEKYYHEHREEIICTWRPEFESGAVPEMAYIELTVSSFDRRKFMRLYRDFCWQKGIEVKRSRR